MAFNSGMDGWTGPLGLVFAVGGRREYEKSKKIQDNLRQWTRRDERHGTDWDSSWSGLVFLDLRGK